MIIIMSSSTPLLLHHFLPILPIIFYKLPPYCSISFSFLILPPQLFHFLPNPSTSSRLQILSKLPLPQYHSSSAPLTPSLCPYYFHFYFTIPLTFLTTLTHSLLLPVPHKFSHFSCCSHSCRILPTISSHALLSICHLFVLPLS